MHNSNQRILEEIENMKSLIQNAQELREKYQRDPQRPKYHFMAPEGICHPFDPQGCIYWKGKYHLFYAVQAKEIGCWGHSSSIDLVHWVHHPVALTISPGDPEKHVFAGGAFINKGGVPTLIYHGVDAGTCIATSHDDDLIRWTKHPGNPIISLPKEGEAGYGIYHVWDTCGWVNGDIYYSTSGNKPNTPPKTVGDVAYLFKSRDLIHWEYAGIFYQSDRRWTNADEDCSCPDFFPLGNKYILMFISHTQGTQYYIGRYEDDKFFPEQHGRMNWPGGPCFAQESLLDRNGRRIFWAWICESRSRNAQLVSGWAGVMSLPRVLSLAEDSTLRIEPAEELSMLRLNHRRRENIELAADSELVLDDIQGDCLELSLEIDLCDAQEFEVKIRRSPNGAEQTVILFDTLAKLLRIDTTRSSLSKDIVQPWPHPGAAFLPNPLDGRKDVRVQEAPFELSLGEPLKLRIFLDRSVLEVFANSRLCMTQRIYPSLSDSLGMALFSRGGSSEIKSLDAWDIAPANSW